jgi:hypothetical protein
MWEMKFVYLVFVMDLYKRHSVLGRTVTKLKKCHNFLGFSGLIWTQGKIVTFSETVARIPSQIK